MNIERYQYLFARLHTAKIKGKTAPHKAILLLAVMQLVEEDVITSSEIELSDLLINKFNSIWQEKLSEPSVFSCDISKPFFHLQHEPFWKLLEIEEINNEVVEELGLYQKKTMAAGYTVKSMRAKFRCAKIDNDLFEVFKDPDARTILQNLLIGKYLSYE